MTIKPEKIIYWFFPFVFIYMALVDIWIPAGSLWTQIVGGLIAGIVTLLNFKYSKFSRKFKFLYLFLLYLGVLILFSSDFLRSLTLFLQFYIPVMMLPLGFKLINTEEKAKRLFTYIFSLSYLYLLNIIIATALGLGGTSYSGETFDVGNVFSDGLHSMAFIIISVPMMIYFYPRRKTFLIALGVILFVLVLVQLKRMPIAAVLVGYPVFFIFYKNKNKFIAGLAMATVVFVIAFNFFSEAFEKQVAARESQLAVKELEGEGRYRETLAIIEDKKNSNLMTILFGTELFNSVGNYAGGAFGRRAIHTAYNRLLHGSGLFGLIFFFFWQLYYLRLFLKERNQIKKTLIRPKFYSIAVPTFISFFVMGLFIYVTGGLTQMLFNSIRYVVLGAILKIFYDTNCFKKLNNN